MLIHNTRGHYSFLKGIEPYSCGVIADEGYEIVHVTLDVPVAWRKGFAWINDYLNQIGEDKRALCGMQLRCPAPYSLEGFVTFNATYL